MNNPKKKKSGSSILPLAIFVIIIGGVVASNFVGPTKDWFSKARTPATTTQVTETPKEVTTPETPVEKPTTPEELNNKPQEPTEIVEKEKPKSEFEIKYQQFIDEYYANSKKPEIGKRYPVVTINGDIRDGILTKVDDDEWTIYLENIQPYNAKAGIHYYRLRPDMAKFFFTKKSAEVYANKMMEKYLVEKKTIVAAPEPVDVVSKVESTTEKTPSTSTTNKSTSTGTLTQYDPTVTDSAPYLAHAALEVKEYLTNQTRMTKKRDNLVIPIVEKCHAKRHGNAAIFYLYVTSQFASQNNEYKMQVIDGIRRFWGMRCMSNGVAGDSSAYLCVVLGDKVIGGSKISQADEVTIK